MLSELNGFIIDKYNQYGLDENKKYSTCPICSEKRSQKNQKQKCLMMDWDTGLATCSHCSEVIQLHTYKKKSNNDNRTYKRPVWQNNTSLSDNLIKWFESRGISQFVLRRLKISEGKEWMPQTRKEQNTVQFNYIRDNELINVKYRTGNKHFKMVQDAEKIPYNLDNIRTSKECIVVEGEIDVLSVVESGFFNCVSSPNGSTTGNVNLEWLDNSIDYFDNKEKIILALDTDEPGQNVQKEIIRRLGAERCYIADLSPYKDFNEVLVNEGKESVKKRIIDAKICPLENIVTYADIKDQLRDFYLNGSKPGYQIGLKAFDEKFSTYTSQFLVVTGVPSSGKSDFVDQMCIGYNLRYDWKIAYCSPENKPEYLHVDKLCRKFIGYRPTNEVELNSVAWKKTEDHIQDNFFFIDFDSKYELKQVLKKGAELVKRKGVKCIVLDPFNKITLKDSNRNDVNQYTNDYLTEIDTFCRKYDVLVIIVAHPVKMRKENGVTPEPDFYDIKGGGEWYDMSYHGLCVHRNYDNGTVKIKVLKVKFQNLGENKAELHYMWNSNNGRYTEFSGNIEDPIDTLIPKWDNTNWFNIESKQSEMVMIEKSAYDIENIFNGETNETPF